MTDAVEKDWKEVLPLINKNIDRWRHNLNKVDELIRECRKCGLKLKMDCQEKQSETDFCKSQKQTLEELSKVKYYLGKDRKNGIIQQHRRFCK